MRGAFVIAAALALSGCMGIGERLQSVGNTICERENIVRAGLEASRIGAYVIQDPERRALLLAAIDESLAGLNACPQKEM